jgi:prefoldin subunit 5
MESQLNERLGSEDGQQATATTRQLELTKIAQMQTSLQTVQTSLQTMQTSLQTMQTSLQTMQTSLQTVQTSLQTMQNSLQTVSTDLLTPTQEMILEKHRLEDDKKRLVQVVKDLQVKLSEEKDMKERMLKTHDEVVKKCSQWKAKLLKEQQDNLL